MRRFFAPKKSLSNDTVTLELEETRHLRDVLRLAEDDEVRVFDGEGKEYLASIESVEKKKTQLRLIREVTPAAPESPLALTLAAVITKGERFDLVVQKSVELGVTRIIPLFSKRCDVKPAGNEKRLERWRKIAIEAAKQSGRARLTAIDAPTEFPDLVESLAGEGSVVLFSEETGVGFHEIKALDRITAIIGPEGGWDHEEVELARSSGISIVHLGGRILRAETAAIAFAALLQNKFGDLK